MNTLNRILVVLTVLLAIPICMAVFVAPVPILDAVGAALRELSSYLDTWPGLLRLALGVLFALAWLFISILLLILELRRPRAQMVRVDKVDGGEVEVSLKTVQEHVAYAVDQLPGVLRARPQVTARKGAVVIEVEVDTAGDMEVPARAAQVVEVVRRVVEERVGVRLARTPRVRLRATPAPTAAVARARSSLAERSLAAPESGEQE